MLVTTLRASFLTLLTTLRPRRIVERFPLKRAALFTAAALIALSSCSSLPISATGNVCNIFHTKRSWHRAALNMQQKWQIPLHVPMAMMYHESKFRRSAKPPRRYILGIIPGKRRSSAYGYSQALDGTWDAYIKSSGNHGANRTNFNDSMDFIGWYMTKSSSLANIPKADPYHQYLAYHEGWTGYRKGSYKEKQWLQRVASEVAKTSEQYQKQYAQCFGV